MKAQTGSYVITIWLKPMLSTPQEEVVSI